MNMIICAIRDSATQAFGRPIFVNARGQAVRSFSDEINRRSGQDSDLSNHPSDFELFQLGSFDDSTGLFSSNGPELIARGADLVSNSKE